MEAKAHLRKCGKFQVVPGLFTNFSAAPQQKTLSGGADLEQKKRKERTALVHCACSVALWALSKIWSCFAGKSNSSELLAGLFRENDKAELFIFLHTNRTIFLSDQHAEKILNTELELPHKKGFCKKNVWIFGVEQNGLVWWFVHCFGE